MKSPLLVGTSDAMNEVLARVAKVAKADTNVCIYGKSGTGKELVARAIHYSGPRADHPPLSLIAARLAFSGTTSGLVQMLDTARQGIPYLRTAALDIKVEQPDRPSKLTADAVLQAVYLPEQFNQQAAEAAKKPGK